MNITYRFVNVKRKISPKKLLCLLPNLELYPKNVFTVFPNITSSIDKLQFRVAHAVALQKVIFGC